MPSGNGDVFSPIARVISHVGEVGPIIAGVRDIHTIGSGGQDDTKKQDIHLDKPDEHMIGYAIESFPYNFLSSLNTTVSFDESVPKGPVGAATAEIRPEVGDSSGHNKVRLCSRESLDYCMVLLGTCRGVRADRVIVRPESTRPFNLAGNSSCPGSSIKNAVPLVSLNKILGERAELTDWKYAVFKDVAPSWQLMELLNVFFISKKGMLCTSLT